MNFNIISPNRLICFLFFSILFAFPASAQTTLVVKKKSGTDIFALSKLDSVIFYDRNELLNPKDQPWKSVAGLDSAAVSAYNQYFLGAWGSSISTQRLNQVCMSDYFRFLGNSEDYCTNQIYNRRFKDANIYLEEYNNSLFKTIKLCNAGLTFMEKNNGDPFPTASAFDKTNNVNRVKGELHFMRAYAYYYLATNFCPPYKLGESNGMATIPLKLFIPQTLSQYWSENKNLKSTNDIYDQIVADLKLAKMFLPTDWAQGMDYFYQNRARANKWAASAFLAQVYFTMQKFSGTESALTELDDVINNGGYSLSVDPFSNFKNQSTSLSKYENPEVILWAFYSDPNLTQKNLFHNSMRFTLFNKSGRDARNGGNGNTSAGTSPNWSNFHSWFQMVLSKSALIEMGWMNAVDNSETLAAKSDLRYYSVGTGVAPTTVNQKGLFYRYEGAYVDTTAYRIAKGVNQLGRRTGASDDGKYIISSKHGQLIQPNEPVVLVNKYYRSTNGYWQNIPVIRLAELYLNRAIIKKRMGIPGWAADYNVVALRAWNTTVGGSYVPKADGEISERLILVERWKELAGEDDWYIPYCQALGYEIGQGDRPTPDENLKPPYTDAFFNSPDFDKSGAFYIYGKNGIQLNGIADVDSVKFVDLPTVTDIDGNAYRTVTVNDNTWMIDHLRTTRYRNGDLIPNLVDSALWASTTEGALCTFKHTLNNDTIQMFGRLYNAYAVADTRNIAPTGWHIATVEEWSTLTNSRLNDQSVVFPYRRAILYPSFGYSSSYWSTDNYSIWISSRGYSYKQLLTRPFDSNYGMPVLCVKDK